MSTVGDPMVNVGKAIDKTIYFIWNLSELDIPTVVMCH